MARYYLSTRRTRKDKSRQETARDGQNGAVAGTGQSGHPAAPAWDAPGILSTEPRLREEPVARPRGRSHATYLRRPRRDGEK